MIQQFCPKCGKARLKYYSNWDDPKLSAYHFEDGKIVDEIKKICSPKGYGREMWCPRCKEWVETTLKRVMQSTGRLALKSVGE